MMRCAFGCQHDLKKLLTPAIAAAADAGFTWFLNTAGRRYMSWLMLASASSRKG